MQRTPKKILKPKKHEKVLPRNDNTFGDFCMQIVPSWCADFMQKLYYRPLKTPSETSVLIFC